MDLVQIGMVLPIIVNLVMIGIAWGVITTKIKNIVENRHVCEEKFRSIDRKFEIVEENHSSATQDIRDEMKSISASLNQLIGKIDSWAIRFSSSRENKNGI